MVLEVVHGAKSANGQNQTYLGGGLKWDVSDAWSLGSGVGVDVGQQSPDFRVTFAFQRALQLF